MNTMRERTVAMSLFRSPTKIRMILIVLLLTLLFVNSWGASKTSTKEISYGFEDYKSGIAENFLDADFVSTTFKFKVNSLTPGTDAFLFKSSSNSEGGIEILIDGIGQAFLRLSLESGATSEVALRSLENPVKQNKWYLVKLKIDTIEKVLDVNFDGERIDMLGEIGLREINNFILRVDLLQIGQDLNGDVVDFTFNVLKKVESPKTLHSFNLTLILLSAVLMVRFAMLKRQVTKSFF
jgi:hypothetical protein